MINEIIIALLSIGFIGSLAAVFVLWSKLDEQKKATAEERDRRWDEISRALSIEKEKNATIDMICVEASRDYFLYCEKTRAMQDKLSAIICPRNDHVWKNGCCIKCGRIEEK